MIEYSLEHMQADRYICINDYPKPSAPGENIPPHHKKGDIITIANNKSLTGQWFENTAEFFTIFPGLFRKLEWHEHRTIDELCSVKFIIILKEKYYLVGDQVHVSRYHIAKNDTKSPYFDYYICGGDHAFMVTECYPTDKELLQ